MPSKEELQKSVAMDRLLAGLKAIDDAGRSVASGATFGLADEFAGAMDTLFGTGKGVSFKDNLASQRKRDDEINPAVKIAGEVVGAIATAPLTAPKLLAGAGKVIQGTGKLAATGRAALVGAAEGAAAGAGNAEGGIEDRLVGAATGAAVGGVAGPVAEGATRAVTSGVRRLGVTPKNRAADLVNRRIQQDGLTLQEAAARIEKFGEGTVLADVAGENVRGITAAAASVPGPGKQKIAKRLSARITGQAARMRQHVAESIASDDFVSTVDDITRRRKEAADPLYGAAFDAGDIGDDSLREFIDKAGPVKAAIREAKKLPQFADMADTDIGVLDQAYKVVGDAANEATRLGRGNRAFNAHEVRARLRKEITDRVPIYGDALESFAGDSAMLDAVKLGRQFIKTDADELPRIMALLSPAEQDMFRVGAARQLRQIIDTTPDSANLVRRMFGTPDIRNKLKTLFPNDTEFRKFSLMMGVQARQAATRNATISGSRTTPLAQEVSDLGSIPKLASEITSDFVMGGPGGAAVSTIARGARALNTPSAAVASEVADLTTNPGGAANLLNLNALNERAAGGAARSSRARAVGAAGARTSGAEVQ